MNEYWWPNSYQVIQYFKFPGSHVCLHWLAYWKLQTALNLLVHIPLLCFKFLCDTCHHWQVLYFVCLSLSLEYKSRLFQCFVHYCFSARTDPATNWGLDNCWRNERVMYCRHRWDGGVSYLWFRNVFIDLRALLMREIAQKCWKELEHSCQPLSRSERVIGFWRHPTDGRTRTETPCLGALPTPYPTYLVWPDLGISFST